MSYKLAIYDYSFQIQIEKDDLYITFDGYPNDRCKCKNIEEIIQSLKKNKNTQKYLV